MTMIFKLKFTKEFYRQLKSLSSLEQKQVLKKLELLSANPLYPSLRTKKFKGNDGIYEMSVNMDLRVLWRYEGNIIIVILTVGHHKEVLGV